MATIKTTDYDGYTIAQMARVIREMKISVPPQAMPYYTAMFYIYSFRDTYGLDSAASIVSYFLANAQTMKGDVMRHIKAELNKQLKAHNKKYSR